MANYSISNKAVDDLTSIWNYTFNFWSERQADRYYEGLVNTFQKIAGKPTIGKNYDKIDNSIFGYLHKKHIVFYTILNPDEIEIVRILHSSMEFKNRIHE